MDETANIRVISICSLKHEHVWKLTSELLPRFIEADEFLVYVPENEVERFLEITNKAIKVIPQSSLEQGFSKVLMNKMQMLGNEKRHGWYLQQFYKIQALIEAENKYLVIWDDDCIPVKRIQLFSRDHEPVYMLASEYYEPYFLTIERLLGLTRVQNQSFIIPGFPILKDWVKDFIQTIEVRHDGFKWFEAIIASTDLSQASGFSETETLGTWVANNYPSSWTSMRLNWERFGQSRFGPARYFTADKLMLIGNRENLDIITFENWDKRGLKSARRRASRILRSIVQS